MGTAMKLVVAVAMLLASGLAAAQLGTPPTGSGTLGSGTGSGTLGDPPSGSGTIGSPPPGSGTTLGVGQVAPTPVRPTTVPRGSSGLPLSDLDDSLDAGLPSLTACLTSLPRPLSCLWQ